MFLTGEHKELREFTESCLVSIVHPTCKMQVHNRSLNLIPEKKTIKLQPTLSTTGSLRLPGLEEPGAGPPHGGPEGDHPQDPLREVQVRQVERDDGSRQSDLQGEH